MSKNYTVTVKTENAGEITFGKGARVFFCGIGGVSMSAIAMLLASRGFSVSGSDNAESEFTAELREHNITVLKPQAAANLGEADLFVYNAAISPDNPELSEATSRGIPRVSRACFLGALMKEYKKRIGICGTHGKSTVTGMIASAFIHANKNPTVLSGARLSETKSALRLGGDDVFIFEACEYKDSFLSFLPTVAVINNIELDHPDYFKSVSQLVSSFSRFAALPGREGTVVYNAENPLAAQAAAGSPAAGLSFGEGGELSAVNCASNGMKSEFDVARGSEIIGHISLKLPGEIYIMNALSAAAACLAAGMNINECCRGISEYEGSERRMEYMGSVNGARVYRDYAHHPTAVKETLKAVKSAFKGKKLLCVFEPHTYSRTNAFFDGFCRAFSVCDKICFTDIYPAREKNLWGVSSQMLAEKTPNGEYCKSYKEAAQRLSEKAEPSAVILVLGAGPIENLCDLFNYDK